MSLLNILSTIVENPTKVVAVLEYLKYFNYITNIKDEDISLTEVLDAIKLFQEQFGIKEQGIGIKTIRAMEWPRCGVKEKQVEAVAGNVAKWGIPDITYYIRSRDSDLAPQIWDSCIQKGLNNWSAVTPLRFHKVDKENQANILFDTGSGRQDDFDGPSGTLAWFQLVPSPNFKGQIIGKFDLSETWIVDAGRGIKLINVATHEIGHGLGLVHSNVSSALMAPFYSPNIEKPQQNDDIPRIQALYGKPTSVPPPSTPVPTPMNTTITINGKIDSISIPGYRVNKIE
jgi:matrix metalloproteinase-14 (membrane-inserted)